MPSSETVPLVHLPITEPFRNEHTKFRQRRVFAEVIAGIDVSQPDPGQYRRRIPLHRHDCTDDRD